MPYIGELKIRDITHEEKDKVIISFKDNHPDIALKGDLYEKIITEEKGKGNVTDNINHLLAAKFLLVLADYGLDYFMVDMVAVAMRTLAHNLREELLRKTFNCGGGDEIPLELLIKDSENEESKTEDKKEE